MTDGVPRGFLPGRRLIDSSGLAPSYPSPLGERLQPLLTGTRMPTWRNYLHKWRTRLRPRPGSLELISAVYSPQLDNRRDLVVYLPASYAKSRRRYPVIYMQDGQNLFDPATSFAGAWGLDEALPAAARRGTEAIVVGIPNMGAERIDEYSPFVDAQAGGGRGELYLEFVVRTIKPLIDSRFRTATARQAAGIGGSSMGGLISLYAFFRYPELFGFTACLSPSLWFAESAILSFVETAPFVPGKIYLDIGSLEGLAIVGPARQLRQILVAKGYRAGHDLRWVEDRSGQHQEASWGRRFRNAIPFLLSR